MNNAVSIWFQGWGILAIEIALIVLAVRLIHSGLGRNNAAILRQRLVWQGCMLALILVTFLELAGGAGLFSGVWGSSLPRPAVPAQVLTALPPVFEGNDFISINRGESGPAAVAKTTLGESARFSLVILSMTLWGLGTTFLCLRMVGGALLLIRFRRRYAVLEGAKEHARKLAAQLGMTRSIHLFECDRLSSPVAFGWFRCAIGVPVGFQKKFTVAEQETMLLHELAHLKAKDPQWFSLADFAVALLWWHPLVWWARRQLRAISELAADQASVLIPDGPAVLAECLVRLGKQAAHPVPGGIRVEGDRLRSALAQRIQRLLVLPAGKEFASGLRWHRFTRVFLLTLILVPAIACSAWIGPRSKGQTMKTSWQHSMAAAALLALANNAETAEPKRSVETSPVLAATVTTASAEPKKAPARRSGAYGKQVIQAKLADIVLEQVQFDGLPLGEVVKFLSDEARGRDPEKVGVNFVINSNMEQGTAIDPATGLPGGTEPIDLAATTILLGLPVRNIRLNDLLDLIKQVADRPINYSIQDYGVMFTPAPARHLQAPLETRTFKVDPVVFFRSIQSTFGIDLPPTEAGGEISPQLKVFSLKVTEAKRELERMADLKKQNLVSDAEFQKARAAVEVAEATYEAKRHEQSGSGEALQLPSREAQLSVFRELLSRLNVELTPQKNIYFNERLGILMVRVSNEEMPTVSAAIETLGGSEYRKPVETARQ